MQGSHKTKSVGLDSVKTGSVVKHSYKSKLEVHSSATAGANRSQGGVRGAKQCTAKKYMALLKQN